MSRLLLGEVSHAMPHEMRASEAAAAIQQQPCPEHSDSATSTGAVADAVDDTSGDEDCCTKGGCECPCLHISAAVTPTLTAHLVTIDQARVPAFTVGSIQDRLSVLFRPPA